jgi:hypothetical protein
MQTKILEHCNTIEECYEFMLAYAAKGIPTDAGGKHGSEIREFLQRAAKAIIGIVKGCESTIDEGNPQAAEKYSAFLAVLERDARASLAAVELVLAQPSISSQLVDNLNASLHLRALLTDLFLVGGILRSGIASGTTR